MKSQFIKLSPITTKAAAAIRQYGEVWRMVAQVEKPDSYFFQTRKPQLYIVPSPRLTRNPRENLGENYSDPSSPMNIGARWIQSTNDPDFDVEEWSPGRKAG